jgi:Carboxypeptidase regulatory-like domain
MKKSLIILGAIAIVLGLAGMARAQQDDDDGPMSDLRFVVVKDYNGKPVRNAAVVLHPVTKKGKQSRGGLELKTDGDGKTNIDGIPYGPLRIQVLAPGFQTFGEDYQIDKPALEITVKLKRPGGQYSTYGDAKKTGEDKPADPKPADPKPQQADPKPQF